MVIDGRRRAHKVTYKSHRRANIAPIRCKLAATEGAGAAILTPVTSPARGSRAGSTGRYKNHCAARFLLIVVVELVWN